MTAAHREHVLIIKIGAFGDVVQAEGAYHDIRDHHPEALITIITGSLYKDLLSRCPWIDRVWSDPRSPRWRLDRMLALGRRLRGGRFTMVYDLQGSGRTAFYRRWILAGTPWSGTAPGCSHPHRHPAPKSLPGLQRMAGQLADAGLEVRHTVDPDLRWAAEDVADLLRRSAVETPYVALIPGSSATHPEKRWPYYGELAERLIADGLDIVLLGGPDETELLRTLPGTAFVGGADFSLGQYAGVLKGAAFVVGNDTGPSHLAAHLWVPGVALFGGYFPAALTSIKCKAFDCLEVERLEDLPAARVYEHVSERLRAAGAAPAAPGDPRDPRPG